MKTTEDEVMTIDAIAARMVADCNFEYMTARMLISAVHSINPLRLAELLRADDFNFVHDTCGMFKHYDVHKNMLMDCFSPRFSA